MNGEKLATDPMRVRPVEGERNQVEQFGGLPPDDRTNRVTARLSGAELYNQFERVRRGDVIQRSGTVVVLASLFFLYGRPQDIVPILGTLRLPMVAAIAAAVVWVMRLQATWTRPTRLMFVFLAVEAVRCFVGKMVVDSFVVNDYWAAQTWKDLALQFGGVFFPLVALCANGSSIRRFIRLFLTVGVFLALYVASHGGKGPGGFLEDENDAGFCVLMFLPYILSIVNESRASLSKKMPLFAVIGVLVIAVISTSSRGGLIGLIAVLTVFFLRSKKKIKLIFTTAILLCVAMPFLSEKYIAKMKTITKTNEGTAQIRIHYWKLAFKVFKDPRHTLWGVGLDNTQFNLQNYETAEDLAKFPSAQGRQTHSFYFEVLPDLGLWGVFVYGSILLACVRSNRRFLREVNKLITRCSLQLRRPASAGPPEGAERTVLTQVGNIRDELEYIRPLLFAANISFVAILSSGAFVSVAYYPPFWTVACVSALFDRYLQRLLPVAQQFMEQLAPPPAPSSGSGALAV